MHIRKTAIKMVKDSDAKEFLKQHAPELINRRLNLVKFSKGINSEWRAIYRCPSNKNTLPSYIKIYESHETTYNERILLEVISKHLNTENCCTPKVIQYGNKWIETEGVLDQKINHSQFSNTDRKEIVYLVSKWLKKLHDVKLTKKIQIQLDLKPTESNKEIIIKLFQKYSANKGFAKTKVLYWNNIFNTIIGQVDFDVNNRVIHGDFCYSQVLVQSLSKCCIIDFEDLSYGNPEYDLAQWIAKIRIKNILSIRSKVFNAEEMEKCMLSVYYENSKVGKLFYLYLFVMLFRIYRPLEISNEMSLIDRVKVFIFRKKWIREIDNVINTHIKHHFTLPT